MTRWAVLRGAEGPDVFIDAERVLNVLRAGRFSVVQQLGRECIVVRGTYAEVCETLDWFPEQSIEGMSDA